MTKNRSSSPFRRRPSLQPPDTNPGKSVIYTFFGGKGGVGKTTCAAATAVSRAEAGRRTLVLSTDPAHSLGDAIGMRLGPRATPVRVSHATLHALELDADRVLHRWLRVNRRVLVAIGERGTYLDRADVERFMDLSFPGVSELLALQEIVRLASAGRYEEAVIDTAPTGHTLRLLKTPDALERLAAVLDDLQAKHRVLVEAVNRRYTDDAADRLIGSLAGEAARLGTLLRDPVRTRFAWVTLAEPLAIAETRDALTALAESGITVDTLVINRVTDEKGRCAVCRARRRAEAASVRAIGRDLLRGKVIRRVPGFDREPVGVAALHDLGRLLSGLTRSAGPAELMPLRAFESFRVAPGKVEGRHARGKARAFTPTVAIPSGRALLTALLESPPRLLFTMGKGGVGKTTCAAALAIAIARAHRNRRVLLLSVDPAHSIADVLAQKVGNATVRVRAVAGLFARELDADAEFARAREAYRAAVDDLFDRLRGDSRFDAAHDRQVARDLIELAPPGLDELFALITMIDLVAEASPQPPTPSPQPPPSRFALRRGSPELGDCVPTPSSGGPTPAPRYDHVIVDTAPMGHALRLFEMRAQAHEWVRTLMTVLLKYGPLLRPGALAAELVALSKGLRQLDGLLADPRGSACVTVTRAARLPRLETVRLAAALRRLEMQPPAFTVVNAVTRAGSCVTCRTRAAAERIEMERLRDALEGCAIILAPALSPPPRGAAALARWIDRWK